jgi:uncharacterized membrane protein YedE/YeeE
VNHDALGTVGAAAIIAAGLLWVARQTKYWLWVLLGGLVGILVLVGAFLLGAAFVDH